jgi:hypothetical protein
MRRSAIVLSLLMMCVPAVAQKQPVDYPLTVHVKSSNIQARASDTLLYLTVVVDGKALELMDPTHYRNFGPYWVLPPGDYKARVSAETAKKGDQFTRSYEFLYSDGTREIFTVVGESE